MNILTREFWAIFKELILQKFTVLIVFNVLFMLSIIFMYSLGINTDYIKENAYFTAIIFYLLLLSYSFYEENKITTFYFIHKRFIEEHGEEFIKELQKINQQLDKGE